MSLIKNGMLVDFIIPTYDRKELLISALSSLLAQDNNDWNANVIVDNPDETFADEIVSNFNDSRIKIIHTDRRYNDWGHTPREIGKQQSTCEYVVMTGDDNYYIPTFVSELKKATDNRPGLVYWDMIHSHKRYSYFKCSLRKERIDMGAFATRTSLAKQIKLKTNFAADGDFVEDFKKKFPKAIVKKIDKVLFVHN